MGSEPQISGISVDYWASNRGVAMHKTVHTISNPQLVGSHTQSDTLTFLQSANLVDSSYEDCTVNAAGYQESFYIAIDIDVTIFTAHDAQLALVSVYRQDVLIAFCGHALVQPIHFVMTICGFQSYE